MSLSIQKGHFLYFSKERRGFEPPSPVKDYTLSKRAHSASMRPLHIKRLAYLRLIAIFSSYLPKN